MDSKSSKAHNSLLPHPDELFQSQMSPFCDQRWDQDDEDNRRRREIQRDYAYNYKGRTVYPARRPASPDDDPQPLSPRPKPEAGEPFAVAKTGPEAKPEPPRPLSLFPVLEFPPRAPPKVPEKDPSQNFFSMRPSMSAFRDVNLEKPKVEHYGVFVPLWQFSSNENTSAPSKENFRKKNFRAPQKKHSKASKSNVSQPRSNVVDFRFDKEAKGQASNEVGKALFKMVNKAFKTILSKEELPRKEEETLQKVGEEETEVDTAPVVLGLGKEVENYDRPEQSITGQEVGEAKTKTTSEFNLCQSPKKPVYNRIQSLNNIFNSENQNGSIDPEKQKNSFGCLLSIKKLVEEKGEDPSVSNFPKTQTPAAKSVSVVGRRTSPDKSSGGFKSFKKKSRRSSFSSERVVEVPENAGSSLKLTPRTAQKSSTPSKSLPRVRTFGVRKTLSTCPQPKVEWDERKEVAQEDSSKPNEEKPAPDDGKTPGEKDSFKESQVLEKKEGDVSESSRCSRPKGNNKKVCVYNCAATKDFNQKFLKSIHMSTTGSTTGKNQKRTLNTDGEAKGTKFSPRPSNLGKKNQAQTGGKVYTAFKTTSKPAVKSNASISSRVQKKKTTGSVTTGNRNAKKAAKEDKGTAVWQFQEEKSSSNPGPANPSLAQAKSTAKEESPTLPSNPQTKSPKSQKTKTKVMKELEVLEKLFSKLKNLQSSMEKQSALDEKKELLKSVEKTYSNVTKLNSSEKKPSKELPENDAVLKQRKSIRTAIIHHVRNWLKLEFAYH